MRKPCENPNCPSFGKPHPNCRCEGVYFAEGGNVDLSNFDSLQEDSAPKQKAPLMFDQLQDDTQGKTASLPSFDDLKDDSEKYGSTGQQVLTGVEGAAQGLAGPLATLAETKLLGVKPEDIAGRAKANPYTHGISQGTAMVGSLMTGYGEAGLIAKGAGAISKTAGLSKMGAAALNLFIQGASFAGSDEITKALLHQPGVDPEPTVATALLHMTANGLITAGTGGLFNLVGKGLNEVGSQRMTDMAEKALAKFAENKPFNKLLQIGGALYAGEHAHSLQELLAEGSSYGMIRKYLGPTIEGILGKPLTKANQYVADAITSALLKENALSVPTAMKWGSYLSKGAQSYLPAMEEIFKATSRQVVPDATDDLMKELHGNIEDGTPQTQIQNTLNNSAQPTVGYAKGGAVQNQTQGHNLTDHFGELFPEQNILLNQAKGRVYGYLNSIRPIPSQKLPFDSDHKDAAKEKSYKKALAFAVNPLQILNEVQKGSLTPEDMKSFTAMWPEIHRLLSKKMTENVVKAQLAGEKPTYSKRQAMSLFMGAALDSTLTPMAIQAAQNTFAQKKTTQQNQAPQKKKKGSLNKSANAYMTDDEAVQRRQQKV